MEIQKLPIDLHKHLLNSLQFKETLHIHVTSTYVNEDLNIYVCRIWSACQNVTICEYECEYEYECECGYKSLYRNGRHVCHISILELFTST